MKTYTPTIGIEVHAELKTQTKMFCASKNEPHASLPNTHVCPVCMGHPGTLPVVNEQAVQHVLKVGAAIKGSLAQYTEFDRKNYFYPDIPKGYQISQYEFPIVKGGVLNNVEITRVHLEEDTARSLHDVCDGSVVDYNRAGVPLMELVTEPVIHDEKTAADFARELQLLLRTLGVSDANMEKGEMRVEANISVSSDPVKFGTKVEVKNLNSFKAVEGAIAYEIKRQTELLEEGGVVVQETRGWDDSKSKTFSQRIKETAHDYRYFPDPDIVKFDLSEISKNIVLPILPSEKRSKYDNIGLTREQIEIIISKESLDSFYLSIFDLHSHDLPLLKLAANYMTTDIVAMGEDVVLQDSTVPQFVSLLKLNIDEKINSRVTKDLLKEVLSGADPSILIDQRGLSQHDSADLLKEIVAVLIAEHAGVVEEVRSGKETALQFLVGKAMKATKGAANPKLLLDLFRKEILG